MGLTALVLAVTITSVSPTTGSTAGGTEVTVRGTDFESCIICSTPYAPGVRFGATSAASVDLVDPTTLVVIAPPHLAGIVDVTVDQWNGSATLENAFTYVSDPGDDHFERILLPLFLPPVNGAFGSLFHTEFRAAAVRRPEETVDIHGLISNCLFVCPPGPELVTLFPGQSVSSPELVLNGKPGRFIYVPDAQVETLAMSLLVRDVSRANLSAGTSIPIVRESELITNRLVLLNVPTDPRFRNTLRIYSPIAWPIRVTITGRQPVDIFLPPGADVFDPAYAAFTDFPIGAGTVDVTVEPTPNMLPVVPPPFWAFVSVTNNETQLITVIVPE